MHNLDEVISESGSDMTELPDGEHKKIIYQNILEQLEQL